MGMFVTKMCILKKNEFTYFFKITDSNTEAICLISTTINLLLFQVVIVRLKTKQPKKSSSEGKFSQAISGQANIISVIFCGCL